MIPMLLESTYVVIYAYHGFYKGTFIPCLLSNAFTPDFYALHLKSNQPYLRICMMNMMKHQSEPVPFPLHSFQHRVPVLMSMEMTIFRIPFIL